MFLRNFSQGALFGLDFGVMLIGFARPQETAEMYPFAGDRRN